MNQIPQVNGVPYVNSAEFVKLTLSLADGQSTEVVTFSSSYRNETIDGNVYTPLGGLMDVSTQQRDLKATGYDTAITLVGMQADNIYYALSSVYRLKGSKIEFYRGFYDSNYIMVNSALRYTGVVTSYTIQETLDNEVLTDSYTITINCSNYKYILENRISGRNTNPTSWMRYNALDTSMSNVPNLINAYFDFGKKV